MSSMNKGALESLPAAWVSRCRTVVDSLPLHPYAGMWAATRSSQPNPPPACTAAIVVAVTACAQEKKGDWVSLFDGQTMSGWTMLELGEKGSSKWEVTDGMLAIPDRPGLGITMREDVGDTVILRTDRSIVLSTYAWGSG